MSTKTLKIKKKTCAAHDILAVVRMEMEKLNLEIVAINLLDYINF
jgi:hypothetical protein